MELKNGRLLYSATDLAGFAECRHLAQLEAGVAHGIRTRPMRKDLFLDRLAKRGLQHEECFRNERAAEGKTITEIGFDRRGAMELTEARDATVAAIRSGVEVIYQAVLFDGRRLGIADFLVRTDAGAGRNPPASGRWQYEVWDTKLKRRPTAAAVLQLCMYSDLLGELQGTSPEFMHLALGGVERQTVTFRFAEYAAYYRLLVREFEAELIAFDPHTVTTEPEPVEHCEYCRWVPDCRKWWREQDDLALVANLRTRQRRKLRTTSGIGTRAELAEPSPALPEKIEGVGAPTLRKLQAQAAIQVRGEREARARGQERDEWIVSERLPPARDREGCLLSNHGLSMLPEPSPGDLFFDIEGDPFYSDSQADGFEYLFGVIEPRARGCENPVFHEVWSLDDCGRPSRAAERRAFEQCMKLFMERFTAHPGMHIYHYHHYETTTLKRLAGFYGARESELDQLLRGQVFVDLFRCVRQGIRASVESYSIKRLEPLYGFRRDEELRDANESVVEFETWLDDAEGDPQSELLRRISRYNRDDCVSTLGLRDWLEGQRSELDRELGGILKRPAAPEREATEDSDKQKEVRELVESLLQGVPAEATEREHGQHGQWLLAQLLDWHRREGRSSWWRYFFLRDELDDEGRRDEPDALGQLSYLSSRMDPTPRSRSKLHRFGFPDQEYRIETGKELHDPRREINEAGVGSVFDFGRSANGPWVELKLGAARPVPTATSAILHDWVGPGDKPLSLQRLARHVLDCGMGGDGPFRAARELLMRRPPVEITESGVDPGTVARKRAIQLDGSYLAIQGPPGSGKSTVGAEMIVDLVEAGRRVGVTAVSHKVIGELLSKVADAAEARGVRIQIGQVPKSGNKPARAGVVQLRSGKVADALGNGDIQVVGGTSWLWAREDMANSVEVLVIDEAGQLSLADAVASSSAARNLVLLGDPQQLEQPLKGTHPPGAGRSVLGHLLGPHKVIPRDFGVFLDGTWRMHPAITEFTSEVFYEGQLHARPGRERQRVEADPLLGSGIRFVSVPHSGCSNKARLEVDRVEELLEALVAPGAQWIDAEGVRHPLHREDVLVITPYNAHRILLTERCGNLRIGTVDKFQGQQAPVAIYSMATSSADLAPRGLEFLYSLNRLNVATSRARCLAVVVASPDLLRGVRCRTPRQMQLVNGLARLRELSDGLT